jgi:hypothetical protein
VTYRVWIVVGLVAAGGGMAVAIDDGELPAFVEWNDVCFPHEMHFVDMELECESCHHETNAVELSVPHEAFFEDLWIDCATCHKTGATAASPVACSSCHHDSPTDVADETLGSKVVIHKSCWNCHEAGTGQQASRSCKTCHSGEHHHPSAQPE